jgi:hypothetical protein
LVTTSGNIHIPIIISGASAAIDRINDLSPRKFSNKITPIATSTT